MLLDVKRRDPEARQQRILEAAYREFAGHGKAGARVERIAEQAGCSVGLLYRRFGNKDQLFEAVYQALNAAAQDELPWEPQGLADYAGRVFDSQRDHPEVMRYSLWRLLEGPGDRGDAPKTPAHLAAKIEALRTAQADGLVSDELDAPQLLALSIAIASMWSTLTAELAELVPEANLRRETIVTALERLTRP